MRSWFGNNKESLSYAGLVTDIHSHLLAGLDDGVTSTEQAKEVILLFADAGYRRLITTPHVMSDYYRNTTQGILEARDTLRKYLKEEGITIEVDAAAEYYLDETVMDSLESGVPFLTLPGNYLLFETNFMTEPLQLKDFIFKARTKGYQPLLAHPERYLYLQSDLSKAEDLVERGVLFQVNIGSLTGQYDRLVKRTAIELVDRRWVHFLGSDCHSEAQAKLLLSSEKNRHIQKALSLPLLNAQLAFQPS